MGGENRGERVAEQGGWGVEQKRNFFYVSAILPFILTSKHFITSGYWQLTFELIYVFFNINDFVSISPVFQ